MLCLCGGVFSHKSNGRAWGRQGKAFQLLPEPWDQDPKQAGDRDPQGLTLALETDCPQAQGWPRQATRGLVHPVRTGSAGRPELATAGQAGVTRSKRTGRARGAHRDGPTHLELQGRPLRVDPGADHLGHNHAQVSHGGQAAVQVALHTCHHTSQQLCKQDTWLSQAAPAAYMAGTDPGARTLAHRRGCPAVLAPARVPDR